MGVTYKTDISLDAAKEIMDHIGASNFARSPAMATGNSSYRGIVYTVKDPSKFKTESWVK